MTASQALPNRLEPAALAHFRILPAEQQAMAIRRLLRMSWSVDDAARVCGMSVDELVHLLNKQAERALTCDR